MDTIDSALAAGANARTANSEMFPLHADLAARGNKPLANAGKDFKDAHVLAKEFARALDHEMFPLPADSAARGNNQPGISTGSKAQRGWQSALARRMNIDRFKVNDVLMGRRTNARVAAAIAEAMGLPASQLWPGKYKRLEYFEKVGRSQVTKAQPTPCVEADSSGGSPE